MPRKKKVEWKIRDMDILKLLLQSEDVDPDKVKEDYLVVAYAIENHDKLPSMLKRISEIDPTDDLRIGLVAIQLDADIRMNTDMQKYHARKYVAETIEKVLYSDVALDGGTSLSKKKKKSGKKGKSKKK